MWRGEAASVVPPRSAAGMVESTEHQVFYVEGQVLPASLPARVERVCLNCGVDAEEQVLRVCGGCGVARYCSLVCQRANWRRHKGAQCDSYRAIRPITRLILPDIEMPHYDAFPGSTLGGLSTVNPGEYMASTGAHEMTNHRWAFTRFNDPRLVAAIENQGGRRATRDELVSFHRSNSEQFQRLWWRMYDPHSEGVFPGNLNAMDGDEVVVRALGVRLSVDNLRRVVIEAGLLGMVAFFGGESTRSQRRHARAHRLPFLPDRRQFIALHLRSEAEHYEEVATMTIAQLMVVPREDGAPRPFRLPTSFFMCVCVNKIVIASRIPPAQVEVRGLVFGSSWAGPAWKDLL